jgi:hypothetical protein
MADEEARQRDALYERAERLASALAAIGDSLRDAVADVNAGKSPSCTPPGKRASFAGACSHECRTIGLTESH